MSSASEKVALVDHRHGTLQASLPSPSLDSAVKATDLAIGVVVEQEATRLGGHALSPFCSRVVGSCFLTFAAAIHATGNATLKQLSARGVNVFAALFLRGVISIVLNLLIARVCYGLNFCKNVISGFPLSPKHSATDIVHNSSGTLAPRVACSKGATYFSNIKSSISVGYGIYLRGLAGSITAAIVLYTITNVMNFADTFALFLGLGTLTTNVVAILYLKEKLRMDIIIGACLCIVGIIFVAKPNFIFYNKKEQQHQSISVYGFTLVVVAASCLAIFNVLARKLNDRSPQAILHGYMVMTAMLNGGIILSNPKLYAFFPSSINQWLTFFLYIGIQIIGQLMLAKGNQYAEAGIASVVNNSELFFTFIVDVIMLGDVLNGYSVLGGCIIFLGAFTTILGDKLLSEFKHHCYHKDNAVVAKHKSNEKDSSQVGFSGSISLKGKGKLYNELVVMANDDDGDGTF